MMSSPTTSRCLLLKILLILNFLVAGSASYSCLEAAPRPEFDQGLPHEYGQVIYQSNQDALNQIFIIGQSHRSPVDGKNGQHTVQVQMEIFRIYEWLIRQKKVELLLPEGFFQRGIAQNHVQGRLSPDNAASPLDNDHLKKRLEDTSRFVSADTLLSARYPIHLGQVEDEGLYRIVSHLIQKLGNRNEDVNHALIQELNDYQKKRTEIMLQNIPLAIESIFRSGDIAKKHAIFTIGAAHITDILEFFHEKTGETSGSEDLISVPTFALQEKGYGITVILPKSLAEDNKAMRLSRLEQFASP